VVSQASIGAAIRDAHAGLADEPKALR
jgi:hypothetical protein